MKIGVLTSSRADFGIYSPLLKVIESDPYFDLSIIAFGTHLSEQHGKTINEIQAAGYKNIIPLHALVSDLDAHSVAISYSDTVRIFADFWHKNTYDLVFCLGDRYEMNAAVQASIPYGVSLAHFHGGEQTLGAIDNIYRHQITLASRYHFTATEEFGERVKQIIDDHKDCVFPVGSISLSDIEDLPLLDKSEFYSTYNLPDKPFILCTFHPETVAFEKNEVYANEMISAFDRIPSTHFLLVSMPNADTMGSVYREKLNNYADKHRDRIKLIESFGKINYFSAMRHTAFLLGNSSSGIIEAASFGKYVVNVGDRQKGRLQSGNVTDVPFNAESIVDATKNLILNPGNFSGKNKYVRKDSVEKVIEILRKIGDGAL